ncbi:MAG: FAD-dependent oxidoreductase [Acidimicrobiia bacterium]
MTDYVIIGAGSAGCVLADRLSASHSVVLLEAGGSDRAMEVAIPAAFSKLFKTERDWDFSTDPEPGADDRSLYLPRGKMLGGSSSMNAMLYIRGRPSDYDGWAEAGAVGWDWASVLPVFTEMEANSRGADEFHGESGQVLVDDLRVVNPLSRAFVAAAMQAGIAANADFNGAVQEGTGFFQVTQRRGRRWSAADAFLRPAMSRPTLEVVTDALVTRVLIEGGRATGVEYVKEGRTELVSARAEVVVAAGAYGSPQLLQLSGIGDPEHLRRIGIEPVVESRSVGENLQDHPVTMVMYDTPFEGSLDDADSLPELARWLVGRRGRLTSPGAEACAFVRSGPDVDEPDLQFHFGPVCFSEHGMSDFAGHAYTFGPVLVSPRSRGHVQTRSADPTLPPAILTNSLSDPADLEALVSGLELAREIGAQSAFDPYRGTELSPGPDVSTRDELIAYVRQRLELLYHPAGTCRMGSDDGAVVDPRLKVRGVDGLRVVDASVMPTVVSGNTNASTMMIAARGAELILADA